MFTFDQRTFQIYSNFVEKESIVLKFFYILNHLSLKDNFTTSANKVEW